ETACDVYIGDDIRRGVACIPIQNVRATCKVHDHVDSLERLRPIGGGKVAHRKAARLRLVLRRDSAHRRDVRDAARGQTPAQRATDKATCAGDQYLSRPNDAHQTFHPCLLKKRSALRVKYVT